MKNKVISLLSLAVVGTVLCACTKEQVLSYSRPFSRAELKEEFKAKNSQVYLSENGELIKINDPDDPAVNQLQELRMSQSIASLYYSDAKTGGFAEELQLSTQGSPKKAPVGTVTWSSSNSAVATVDQNGLVSAISEGVAIVTATSAVGVKAECRVVVNNTNVLLSKAAKSAAKILATQKSDEFEPVSKIKVTEDYTTSKTRDGVVVSRSAAAQTMWASVNDAYFRITSNDEDIKTADGSVVPSSSAYVFYTTDDYLSYIFCNSDGKSNYMYLDQSYLVDEEKTQFQALGEILQSFFVAGSKIMTDQFKNILGQSWLDGGYGSPKYKGSLGEDSGEFAFNSVSVQNGRLGPEDAADFDLPAGTYITITDDIRYLWEDNLLKARLIDEKLEYDIGGEHFVEEYIINYYFEGRGVELWWPQASNYSQVDSIFDL